MRILIATSHFDMVGGTEKYLQALIPGLINRGHEVGMLYEFLFDPKTEIINARELSLATWCLQELGPQNTLSLIEKWKPEVVYSHGLQATDLEGALVKAYATVLYA